MDDIFLGMGIEAKGRIEKRKNFGDFIWVVDVHHLGPDDISSRSRLGFATAQMAFGDLATNFGNTAKELIEDYNSN